MDAAPTADTVMTNSPSDETALVRSVLAGNRDDFAPLVRLNEGKVRSLCASILPPAEADDAAQEVFLKAFRKLGAFRFESSFSTWIYRIAYRHCLDTLRARGRRRAESLDRLREEGAPVEPVSAAPDAAAEDAREILDELPPDYRLVLTLRELQGLSYSEIAEVTGASLDSVKARLRRARGDLQERARHFFNPSDV